MQIIPVDTWNSEINTYSCHYQLKYNNHIILRASGKGTTELYSKASCFSELYERFCAYPKTLNFLIAKKQQELVSHENQKKMSYEEILLNPYLNYEALCSLPGVSEEYLQKYIDSFYNGIIYADKYINLLDANDVQWNCIKTIIEIAGTTGLAAGNTLEEALVQGLSELFERFNIHNFCFDESNNKFYYLNNENLPSEIKTKVQKLESLNYDVRFYDLSYNYNIPTLLLLIRDKITHNFHIVFGCAPVFNIAAERCLTEMYQGTCILPNRPRIWTRAVDCQKTDIQGDYFQSSHIHDLIYLHDQLIYNSEQIDNYNSKYYLSNNTYSQIELLNFLKNIIKENNLNIYYTNISLTDKMQAIHICFKDVEIKSYNRNNHILSQIKYHTKVKMFDLYYNFVTQLTDIVFNKKYLSEDDLETKIQRILSVIKTDHDLSNFFAYLNKDIFAYYSLYTNSKLNYINFINIALGKFADVAFNEGFTVSDLYQKYLLLFIYKNDKTDIDKLTKIFNFLNIPLTEEDYTLSDFTPLLLLSKVYLEPLIETLNSIEYTNFLIELIKND